LLAGWPVVTVWVRVVVVATGGATTTGAGRTTTFAGGLGTYVVSFVSLLQPATNRKPETAIARVISIFMVSVLMVSKRYELLSRNRATE
jgi:hypothetical protein